MASGCLGYVNRLEEGALSAGSEIVAAPVTNVIVPQGAEPWVTAYGVTTAAAGARLACDAGAALSWRAFGLFRTNLSRSATVRYMLGTTPGAGDVMDTAALAGVIAGGTMGSMAYGDDLMDSTALAGLVIGANQHVYVHPQQMSARYLTVEIEDAANPDGQIMIGLAFAGPVIQPRINFDWPSTSGRQHRTDRAEAMGGQGFSRPRWQKRVWELQWNGLDETEALGELALADMYGRAGGGVLWVPDPDGMPMRDAVYGDLTDPSPFSWPHPGSAITRAWRATIVERL